MKRSVFLISSFVLASGCAVFLQAQTPAPPVQVEEPPVLTVPDDYRYNARGRRDPFVNPVPKPKTVAASPPIVRPPGLRGVLVAEAQVAGVVTSKTASMNVAIIAAPGTKTPYFARVGDQLYDAVVKRITIDAVTFTVTGPSGDAKSPRDVIRRVRPNPGEDK